MKDLEFHSMSKEDLLVAAKEAQKSGQSHFNVAENAATMKHYGIANSLLILAVEECIKSAILTAGFFSVKLPFEIDEFFKDHRTKHIQAAEIQPLVNFISSAREVYIDILRNRKSVFGTFFKFAMANVFTAIFFEFNEKIKQFRDFGSWWNLANNQKNNGFYVGFFDGQWKFPTNINEETYLQTLSMAKPFVECLQVVQELRSDDYLLFSNERQFTQQEMDESEVKLTLNARAGY